MHTFLAMAALNLVAMVSPGPDFFLVVRNSFRHSPRTGMWTAVGIACGLVIHMTYCILGLGFVISQSILVFNVLKYLGAGYLICIGIASFLSSDEKIDLSADKAVEALPPLGAVKMGFMINALNPKATLAFVSIFSAFVKPDTPLSVQLAFAVFVVVTSLMWFSFVSSVFTIKKVQTAFGKAHSRIDRTVGVVLVSMGLKVIDV